MKKLFAVLLLLPLFSNAQIASRLLPLQSNVRDTNAPNILYIDTLVGGQQRIYVADKNSFKILTSQVFGFADSVLDLGDNRYAQLLGAYNNPAFVNNLSAAKVFGLSSVALSGDYLDLSNRPNMALYYLSSNPNGYINGINSGMVTAALGYVPYSNANPNSYITGINSGNVTTALGFTPYNATNPNNYISRAGISVTNTGSGSASYNSSTGVINIPTAAAAKRIETYSGTTNASGVYTVTFPSAFAVAPNIQASITNQSATNQFIRVSNVTTTGCTINVFARSAVTLLSIEVLLAATTNVSGANVDILAIEK